MLPKILLVGGGILSLGGLAYIFFNQMMQDIDRAARIAMR